jgi:hypothetical protein
VNGGILTFAIEGSTVFVGGTFSSISGVSRIGFAAITDPSLLPAATLKLKGKAKLTTPRSRVVLRGTSKNATAITFKADKGKFKKAKGSAGHWKIPLRLEAGRTTVKIRASGPGGSSKILIVKIRRT